ncbi:uncharacterized protein LOC119283264 isoform X2 [Triticum dicoccoides]|uniref:uncharacterized protein LOC119283264 isoform X2 n=1 Tax=Triticum dicoccoides TaxID=85692 RepID=UPI00188DD717|nr:uncharacterized protein LOC119283264 isoform X2 [Triticum dicoccoides]
MRRHRQPTVRPICRRLEPPACAVLWCPVAAAPHLGVATSAREELLHEEAKGAPPPPPPAGLRPVAPCGGGEGRDGRREACRRGFGGASRSPRGGDSGGQFSRAFISETDALICISIQQDILWKIAFSYLQFNLLLLGGEQREGILFYGSEDSCYVLYCHATASGLHLANWRQRCLWTTDFFYSYAQSTDAPKLCFQDFRRPIS